MSGFITRLSKFLMKQLIRLQGMSSFITRLGKFLMKLLIRLLLRRERGCRRPLHLTRRLRRLGRHRLSRRLDRSVGIPRRAEQLVPCGGCVLPGLCQLRMHIRQFPLKRRNLGIH